MRVTEGRMIELALAAVGQNKERLNDIAQELSSGVRVAKASTDPAAWAEAARERARSILEDSRGSAVARASDRLKDSEQQLTSIGEDLNRALELTTQLANDTYTPAQRQAGAQEVRTLRASVLAALNAQGSDGASLFAGSRTAGPAFDAAGTYLGDAASQAIEIAAGERLDTSTPGDRVATAGINLFGLLDSLDAALISNDGPGLRGMVGTLGDAVAQVADARSEIGRQAGAMNRADEARSSLKVELDARIGRLVGSDPVAAASELARASSGLEAARATAQKILELMKG